MGSKVKKYFCNECSTYVELVPPEDFDVDEICCPACGCLGLREEKVDPVVYLLNNDDYYNPSKDCKFNSNEINRKCPLTLTEFQKIFNNDKGIGENNYIYFE